jgi:hypothetical protein
VTRAAMSWSSEMYDPRVVESPTGASSDAGETGTDDDALRDVALVDAQVVCGDRRHLVMPPSSPYL